MGSSRAAAAALLTLAAVSFTQADPPAIPAVDNLQPVIAPAVRVPPPRPMAAPWPQQPGTLQPAPETAGGAYLPPVTEQQQIIVLQKPEGATTPQSGSPTPAQSETERPKGEIHSQPSGLTIGLPTRSRVFLLDGPDALERRIINDLDRQTRRAESEFEDLPPLAPVDVQYQPKTAYYPPLKLGIEPGYVVHRRLMFEEKNAERYGWDAGLAQPLVSTLYFYRDTLLWPAKLASNRRERYETSLGKCLPGSPVPYRVYPLEIDAFGAAVGVAGFYTGIGYLLP
ncbi:MAG: hypothetical protein LC104_18420 [Bacteroidales bacterium]|nr:hypothetical protein [Bacteroidales bacterium]